MRVGGGALKTREGGHLADMPEEPNSTPPPQSQPYPGDTGRMNPEPRDEMRDYVGRDLLAGKRALITGGDSGIGRAVAIAFAKEGADVAIAYLVEHEDANHTRKLVEEAGRRCVLIPGTSPTAITAGRSSIRRWPSWAVSTSW
nr:hypothetical protein GCM10020093_011850 [Planobispora longispora]